MYWYPSGFATTRNHSSRVFDEVRDLGVLAVAVDEAVEQAAVDLRGDPLARVDRRHVEDVRPRAVGDLVLASFVTFSAMISRPCSVCPITSSFTMLRVPRAIE